MRATRRRARPGLVASLMTLAGLIAGLITSPTVSAGEVHLHYVYDAPTVAQDGGRHVVTLEGALTYGAPGAPALPRAGVQALLPPGEVISHVEVIPGEEVVLPGVYRVACGQPQVPLSETGPQAPCEPDAAVYGSATAYPPRLHGDSQTGMFRGYAIGSLALHPVRYLPSEGRLSYFVSFEVVLHTRSDDAIAQRTARMIRHDEATCARLARIVDNPEAVSAYATIERAVRGGRDLNPEDAYRYLIIAGDPWADGAAALVDFETQRGHKAGLFTRSWILSNYTGGVDDQEDIRNFIIDAYQTWDVDYVLLVGDARDDNGIPHRGLYSTTPYGSTDSDIPADMYYGCLDGTWNDDGDSRWGEPGEDDLYHEVGVARACIDSEEELTHFITKVMRYQDAPVVAECDEALMVGELLWSDPTWGGDYKDEIKDGSSAHGYTTVGFPPHFNVDTLYDRTATWSKYQLIDLMNGGLHIVNHLGHCNVTYAMKMDNPDIGSFTNDGLNHTYNIVYSQGCYCGSMDNRNDYGSYTDDCFAEEFQSDDHGAAALVMNSRYGWGMHQSTNGSSQYFDRQFFDAVFGEGIYALADVNDDSKMDNIWAITYGANRWCYYQLNAFGDPAMELWTAEPAQLTVEYPDVVFLGAPDMDVDVFTQGGGPVEGARVVIFTDDYAVYDVAVTDATGHAQLHPNAQAPGTLQIRVVAHDHLVFQAETPIIPPAGAYLVYHDSEVHDEGGDQDGHLDWAEDVGVSIMLENVGVEDATNVSALLSTEDPYVTVHESNRIFLDIPAGGIECCLVPYVLAVAGNIPDQQVVRFDLLAAATQGSWESHFNLIAQAPVLAPTGLLVNDLPPHGNGDGGADPGETVYLQVWLENTGHADARDLTAEIACAHPDVVIIDGEGTCVSADVGQPGLVGSFAVELLPSCPDPAVIDFTLSLSGAAGFTAELTFAVDVGAWFDDVETDRGWTLGALGDDATTGHWTRAEPLGTWEGGQPVQPDLDHTPDPAEICFVTANGSQGGSVGEADVDNGRTTLLTPAFDLSSASEASVSYWRWYTNDLGNNPGQDWWTVDVTSDGENWEHLEYTQESDNSWTYHEFDLLQHIAFSDRVQLRFIAADESPGSLVEAAVDDFSLTVVRAPASGSQEVPRGLATAILSYGPNPIASQARIVYRLGSRTAVDLALYDLNGRRVRTLVREEQEAGVHPVSFDGLDATGRGLPSGIYFLRLDTPEVMQVRQVTLLH